MHYNAHARKIEEVCIFPEKIPDRNLESSGARIWVRVALHVLHCVFVGEENDGSRKSRLPAKRVCATCPWGFMGDISGSPRLSRSPRLSGSPRLVGGARKRAPLIRVAARARAVMGRWRPSFSFPSSSFLFFSLVVVSFLFFSILLFGRSLSSVSFVSSLFFRD